MSEQAKFYFSFCWFQLVKSSFKLACNVCVVEYRYCVFSQIHPVVSGFAKIAVLYK
jgi:hypothetical protein